jgi:hypothetical protein
MAQAIVIQQPERATRKRPVKDVRKPLNLRVRPEVRSLIDYGAELTGKNLTDFVLDCPAGCTKCPARPYCDCGQCQGL